MKLNARMQSLIDRFAGKPANIDEAKKAGLAELNVGWLVGGAGYLWREHNQWRVATGAIFPYVPGENPVHVSPIPTAAELCDPASEWNKAVFTSNKPKVPVPAPGWRFGVEGDSCKHSVVCHAGKGVWQRPGRSTFKNESDLIDDWNNNRSPFIIVPISPSSAPFVAEARLPDTPNYSVSSTTRRDPTKEPTMKKPDEMTERDRLCIAITARGFAWSTKESTARLRKRYERMVANDPPPAAVAAEKTRADLLCEADAEMVKPVEPKPAPKFKVGDRVRVVGNSYRAAPDSVGMLGKVTDFYQDSMSVDVEFDSASKRWASGVTSWSFAPSDLELLSPAPAAPFAMPEFDFNVTCKGTACTLEGYKSVGGKVGSAGVIAQSELDALAAELARRESDNARLAARVKELEVLEGNVSSERAIDYRAIRKLTGLDDSAKVGDVMRRIEALAMAEAERDAARADVEKARRYEQEANERFGSVCNGLSRLIHKIAGDAARDAHTRKTVELMREYMTIDPPPIPDPTAKEASHGKS